MVEVQKDIKKVFFDTGGIGEVAGVAFDHIDKTRTFRLNVGKGLSIRCGAGLFDVRPLDLEKGRWAIEYEADKPITCEFEEDGPEKFLKCHC